MMMKRKKVNTMMRRMGSMTMRRMVKQTIKMVSEANKARQEIDCRGT